MCKFERDLCGSLKRNTLLDDVSFRFLARCFSGVSAVAVAWIWFAKSKRCCAGQLLEAQREREREQAGKSGPCAGPNDNGLHCSLALAGLDLAGFQSKLATPVRKEREDQQPVSRCKQYVLRRSAPINFRGMAKTANTGREMHC